MKKQVSIYIAQRIILRGCYAEEGETHVVSEGELADLQAMYPSAIVVEDGALRDVTEPAFDPLTSGTTPLQDGTQPNDAATQPGDSNNADAGDDAEDGDANQPGATGRKGDARRAGAKRPA